MDHAVFDLLQQTQGFHRRDYHLAGVGGLAFDAKAILPDIFCGNKPIGGLHDAAFAIEHVEHLARLETGTLADLKVVEIMSRCDFYSAGTQFGVGMFVGDNRDQTASDRQTDIFAHQMCIAFIRRVHRDRHVGQHRFRARGGHADETAAVLQRIFEMPEFAVDLPRFDLKIRDRGFQARVPVDEPLVAVEQPLVIEIHKHLDDGL